MSTISSIRDGLVTAAKTVNAVSGLGKIRGFPYAPDTINPPVFIVYNYAAEFDLAYARGTDKLTFDVEMVVERQSERLATKALDTYVVALKAALESDQTLSGTSFGVRVASTPGYQPRVSGNESTYRLAAPLSVEVHTAVTTT